MIASGDGDLAEVVFRHPRFVHVAAHDKGNLAVGSHHAEWHFVVAGVRRLAAAAAVFAEGRGGRDDQYEIAKSGRDRRCGVSQQ